MYKLSINKDLFEKIYLKKEKTVVKPATTYWKKELFNPKIIDDAIFYEIKDIKKLLLQNSLGEDKPQIVIECIKLEYKKDDNVFLFHLGKILEQKNIENIEDDKDIIIKNLLKEREDLKKLLEELKYIGLKNS